jgi:hypothetical protein
LLSAIALAFAALVLPVATNATEIRLRSSAACASPIVRLSDVAEVFADDPRFAQSLADTPLGPAPPVKGHRTLTQSDVRQLLVLSGVGREAAIVTGSETVTITTDSSDRAAAMARRPLIAAGLRQTAFEAEAATERRPQPASRWTSRFTPRAESAPTASDSDSTAFNLDQPIKAIPIVDRGTSVTVHARTGGVRVTASGKALEPGAAGETIPVEMADTKQKVMARVVSSQVVEVSVGGSNPATANPASGRGANP